MQQFVKQLYISRNEEKSPIQNQSIVIHLKITFISFTVRQVLGYNKELNIWYNLTRLSTNIINDK